MGLADKLNVIGKYLFMDDKPPEEDSKLHGELPISMAGYWQGEEGISKIQLLSTKFDVRITARMRYALRKNHSLLAAVHNSIIKQVKKVEIEVAIIDEIKEFNEDTKKRMEEFTKTGFCGGEKELRATIVDTKKWYGDSFSEIVFDSETKEPIYVKKLITETINVLPNDFGEILGYPQVLDGELNYVFPPANIIHLKEHEDEYNPFFGYSDLDSLWSIILLDTLATEANIDTLNNAQTPPGILAFDDLVSQKDLMEIKRLFILQNKRNPGKPVFLTRVKNWFKTSLDLNDFDWQALHQYVKERVMSVYGVEPIQMAVVETGKLANPEQQLEVGDDYIKQELEIIQMFYNSKLTPFFQNSENLMFRFTELDPKVETQQKEETLFKTKIETAKIMSSIPDTFTINEVREYLEFESKEGGDEYYTVQTSPADNLFNLSLTDPAIKELEGKPFAGYENFDDCVSKNRDKDDPQAYCSTIMRATEGKSFKKKDINVKTINRKKAREKFIRALRAEYRGFTDSTIKLAEQNYSKNKSKRKKSLGGFKERLGARASVLANGLTAIVKEQVLKIFAEAKGKDSKPVSKANEKAIEALLKSGKTLNAVKTFSKSQRKLFANILEEGFRKGLAQTEIVKLMQKVAKTEPFKLARIARTETTRFANQGRFAGYKEQEELKGSTSLYDWIGPMDYRTTPICKSIAARNPYSLEKLMKVTKNGLPHINCRHVAVRRTQ